MVMSDMDGEPAVSQDALLRKECLRACGAVALLPLLLSCLSGGHVW